MLTWFRNKAKIFLIVIIVTFVILIFVDWGTGRMRSGRGFSGAIARVHDRDIPPEQLDYSLQQVYQRLEMQMEQSGDPSPSYELSAMADTIARAAWDEMIDNEVEARYLRGLDWPAINAEHARSLFLTQIELSGIEDADAYFREVEESPGYQGMLVQAVEQLRSASFPAAARLQNMASRDELEYYIAANYMPVTARYVAFQAFPPLPSDEEMRAFYDSHPELFTSRPYGTLRFVAVSVQPDSSDIARASATVDSLSMSGAPADTIVLTRGNLLAVAGVDSSIGAGGTTAPYLAPSLRSTSFVSMHVMKVFEVRESPASDLDDTLGVMHWEAPALPGTVSMRNTLYAVEDNSGTLLEGEIPWSDSLPIADWGTVTIEKGSPQNSTYPPAMVSFALDSAWTDSIGPVCFVPSFQGGYPALIVAKRLDQSFDSNLQTFEEASASGTLLVTAYSRLQADSSMAMAGRALSDLAASGLSLGVWAEQESLAIMTTPEFTASQVRQNSTLDPDAFGGLLNNGEFGIEALTAPLLTPIGPFRTGGSAVIAEIDTRSEMPMPGDPAVLAPMYLGLQSGHSFSAIRHLVSLLREDAGVVDLREEYEAAMDSLRGSSPAPQAPIDY